MNKFDELSVLAAKYSLAIFDNQRQCQRAADRLMRTYAEYLGCPLDNVDFLRLDSELNTTTTNVKLGGTIPMVLDGDGYWHFCGRIRFEGPDPDAFAHELFKLAVKYQDGLLIIREDQDFRVDPADLSTLQPFFEHLYKNSREGFSSPLVRQSKRIGFTQ